MGRVVAVQLGMDHLPGTTITRYCSSSLQTTRMAMHAIKAGEGDVFISAGVEMVSRFVKGNSDSLPDTQNPLFADAQARAAKVAESGADYVDRPARERPRPRRLHRDGPDRREPRRLLKNVSRQEMDEFAVRSAEPRREGDQRGLLGAGDHPGHDARRHRRQQGRRPARRHHARGDVAAEAGVPARRPGDRGQRLPAQRRRGRGGRHERHQGRRARPDPAGPDRLDRRSPASRPRSWATARSRRRSWRCSGPG